MLRTAFGAFAFWRAERCTDLAEHTRDDPVGRLNLRDKALVWQFREHLVAGLMTPRTYAVSVRMLKANIRSRRALERPLHLRGLAP